MDLFIQCMVLCIAFTLIILPAQFKNPLSQITSYPPAIQKRVESLPQYRHILSTTKQKSVMRKISGTLLGVILLALLAWFSGKTTFNEAFTHVFILFFAVNLYDLLVLDFIVFPNSKRVVIPGTEDMIKAYKNPVHHMKGALKGVLIGGAAALLAACLVVLMAQTGLL